MQAQQAQFTTMDIDVPVKSDATATQMVHTVTIVAGRQSGAKVAIEVGSTVSMGTGIDNEVVLFCQNGESCRLLLDCQGDRREDRLGSELLLRVLAGRIEQGETMLESGAVYRLQDADQFAVGDTRIMVTLAQPSQLPEAEQEELLSMNELQGKPASERTKGPWWSRPESLMSARPLIFSCLGLGSFLLLTVLSSGLVQAIGERDQAPTFEQRLAATGLKQVRYLAPDGTAPERVVGAVASHDQQRRVLNLARRYGGSALEVDLQVNEALSASIEDLYRVNGVRSQVTVTGLGEVSVWSATNDLKLLDLIESRLENDFPNVVSMTRDNVAPVDKVVVSDRRRVMMRDPNKQVTLVVAGADGYLMTKDKSRYFVGSLLPSGHEIKRIENGNVYVQSDGEVVRLEF